MRFVVAALLAVTGAGGLTPVHFAQRTGWYTGAGTAHACPGVSEDRCSRVSSWASTVRWRDCVDCLPHRTVAALPPTGIAMQVSLVREIPLTAKEALKWPPRVRATDLVSPFEGLPARIAVYQKFVQVGRVEAYVLVLFGRSRPDATQIAAANAELKTARLP